MLECHADEIIFTSGGSESNNYAIKVRHIRLFLFHSIINVSIGLCVCAPR